MISQRILVTGGAGFIGSHTVECLLQQKKQVVVLDNLSTGRIAHLPLHDPNLEFIEGDILEYPLLAEIIASCDGIIHLAAIASVPQSIENPIYSFQVNTQGFLHVLEAMREAKRSIRLVHASSAAIYGNATHLPCDDTLPVFAHPLSPYALQKSENERYGSLYHELHGIGSIALRYFNVYGKRQHPNSPYSGVISRFIDAYLHDQPLTVFGDGKQVRDFIHVRDVAIANAKALESHYVGALNIATGKAETLLDLIRYIEQAGYKKAEVNFVGARPGDITASYASVALAESQLGFRYSVDLAVGIKELALRETSP